MPLRHGFWIYVNIWDGYFTKILPLTYVIGLLGIVNWYNRYIGFWALQNYLVLSWF